MSEAWIETYPKRAEVVGAARSPRSMSEAWIETGASVGPSFQAVAGFASLYE